MFRLLVLLVVITAVFLGGCRGTSIKRDDVAMRKAILDRVPVAIGPFATEHAGNTGMQAVAGGAIGGAVGYMVFAAVDQGLGTVPALDREVADVITAELGSVMNITRPIMEPDLLEALSKDKPKANDVIRFASVTQTQAILKVWLRFTHRDNLDNRVAINAQWQVFNTSGEKVLIVNTFVYSENKSALLPDTRNPKYHADYVNLARESTREFIRMVQGETID